MLQEARDLQNSAVLKLVNALKENKKEFTFKAPTGSGKTYMMASFMERILSENSDVVFIVSSLSKSALAEQNYNSFKKLSECGVFTHLSPYLINSETSGEAPLYIPENYNVYVLPRDLYKDKSRLKGEGVLLNFLHTLTDGLLKGFRSKEIYLIKDECHIATKNLDSLYRYFSYVINFSATPKLSRGQLPDVEMTNAEAEEARIIKRVEEGSLEVPLENALSKFDEIKEEYINKLEVNPAMIIQISNKDKAEEELENTIFPALNKYEDLKWVYITGEDKSCKTNDKGLRKIPASRWKDYLKEKTSSVSVIIFKMVISEGWDIPRACMLYQIRDSKSSQLDEQVMGRVRRNPRLSDFEKLSEEAQELALTAWVWGIIPKSAIKTIEVRLNSKCDAEKEIRIKPTKLSLDFAKSFNIKKYIEYLDSKREALTHKSVFDLYRDVNKSDLWIQNECYKYAKSYSDWFLFAENLAMIKSECEEKLTDYKDSLYVCKDVSLPYSSIYTDNGENSSEINLEDWVWKRKDKSCDFAFDSIAERKWAEVLKDIRFYGIKEKFICEEGYLDGLNLPSQGAYLWGKNYPYNSEIKFEYFSNGIHSSYPDFVLKDKAGGIHIFEVKSVNKSGDKNINEAEYAAKVNDLKLLYKECSVKTGHIFYLPVMTGSDWQITRFKNGTEDTLTKFQFIDSLKNISDKMQNINFNDMKKEAEKNFAAQAERAYRLKKNN